MSLIGDIAGSYRDPAKTMQIQLERGIKEPQTLFYGMFFGVINLIASFPQIILSTPDKDTFTGVMAGLFISYVFFLPLMLFGLAGVLHWVLIKFKGKANYAEARRAFVWSAVTTTPLILLSGAFYVFNNSVLTLSFNVITFLVFVWQICINIIETEFD